MRLFIKDNPEKQRVYTHMYLQHESVFSGKPVIVNQFFLLLYTKENLGRDYYLTVELEVFLIIRALNSKCFFKAILVIYYFFS